MVVALLFAALSLLSIGDCMRETDQASVLNGAWHLYQGDHIAGQAFYNYDKLYQTYWISALAFWVRSHFGSDGWSPVFVGNIASGIVFWTCILLSIWILLRGHRKPGLPALICFLGTPAILINSVYTNPAILSAGFLVLSGSLILTARSAQKQILAAIAFGIAVGARGDAVLLAPLFVWLRMARHGWLKQAISSSITILLGAAIVIATVLGRLLYTGKPLYFDPVFLGSKVFIGYFVFGLGALLLLLLLIVSALLGRVLARATTVSDRTFFVVGIVAILLPAFYYSLQLWSPRYLVTTAVGTFLFTASGRGRALLLLGSLRPSARALQVSFALIAIVSLFVGLQLPSIKQVRLTMIQPTVFPTADGLTPIGAYAGFLLQLRDVQNREVDHNQLVWKAARGASYEAASDGFVHILDTPMRSYLELAATLQGLPSKVERTKGGLLQTGPLYAESRVFMRLNSDQADATLAELLTRPARIVSPSYKGIAILRFAEDGDRHWANRVRVLDDLFMGNEYRLYSPETLGDIPVSEERPFALIAADRFAVALNGREVQASQDFKSGFFYVRGDTRQLTGHHLDSEDLKHTTLAIQVLPAWMSVHNR